MYIQKDFDFSAYGAFFAFSNEQLQDGMKEHGINEISELIDTQLGGLIAKKSNYKEMIDDMEKHYEDERKKRLEADGLEAIIRYELGNYECWHTGNIDESVYILSEYGATKDQIWSVFKGGHIKE